MKLSIFSPALPLVVLAVHVTSAAAAEPERKLERVTDDPNGNGNGNSNGIGPDKNRFIVEYKNNNGLDKAKGKAKNGKVHIKMDHRAAVAITIEGEGDIDQLRDDPDIISVEKDEPRYAEGVARVRGASTLGTQKGASTADARSLQTDPLLNSGPCSLGLFGIDMVQANQLEYDSTSPGASKKICVIDSGYDFTHEDLPKNYVTGTDDLTGAGPWKIAAGDNSHGTHCAGTIAAIGNNGLGVRGVIQNEDVHMHIVRVFGSNGAWAYSSTLANAVDDCVDNGADVISMSLGGGGPSSFERNAFESAKAQGVLSIASAGNGGNSLFNYPASYDAVVSVAAIDINKNRADFSQYNSQVELSGPGVDVLSTVNREADMASTLGVEGTEYCSDPLEGSPAIQVEADLFKCPGLNDCTGAEGKICLIERGDFSFADKVLACENAMGLGAVIYNNIPGNFGGTLGGVATTIPSSSISQEDGQVLVTLLASGTQVADLALELTLYAPYSGTSMACPHVAGVAALVWSQHPACSSEQIRTALQYTASDLGTAGRDVEFGFGLVQAKAASDCISANGCSGCAPATTTTTAPSCNADGAPCSINSNCCSNRCRGRRNNRTCRG